MKNTLYLINPKSNGGRSMKSWRKLQKKHKNLPEEPVDLTKTEDLPGFIKKESPDLLVVTGGDGGVNSVAGAIMSLDKKPTLAVIPMGFGNALAYNLGIESTKKAVEVIQDKPKIVSIDVMKTNIRNLPYGLFAISVGFDAQTVWGKDEKFLKPLNPYSYIFSAVSIALTHKPKKLDILIDGKKKMSTKAASLMVSNGPLIGKNIMVSGQAELDDGLLDCTIFLSKMSYVKNLRYKGQKHPLFSKKDGKIHFKAKSIRISGEDYVQVDGEAATLERPLELSIAKERLNFLGA
ncbi:diacylglycerol/lipid kinase family protein [Patescibacteria group bacterium]